jgi:hypothetical protein
MVADARRKCTEEEPMRFGSAARIRPVMHGTREGPAQLWFSRGLTAARHSLLGHPIPAAEFRVPHGRPTWRSRAAAGTGRSRKPRRGRDRCVPDRDRPARRPRSDSHPRPPGQPSIRSENGAGFVIPKTGEAQRLPVIAFIPQLVQHEPSVSKASPARHDRALRSGPEVNARVWILPSATRASRSHRSPRGLAGLASRLFASARRRRRPHLM